MGDFLSTQFLRIYKTHEFQNLHITNIIINISALEMFYDNCLYKSILHYSTLHYIKKVTLDSYTHVFTCVRLSIAHQEG